MGRRVTLQSPSQGGSTGHASGGLIQVSTMQNQHQAVIIGELSHTWILVMAPPPLLMQVGSFVECNGSYKDHFTSCGGPLTPGLRAMVFEINEMGKTCKVSSDDLMPHFGPPLD